MAKARRVQQDGIHFQGFRYLDLTLAAYVGETVTIRYDPRDLAEIRVYHGDASCVGRSARSWPGKTISLKDIVQARNARRRRGADRAQRPGPDRAGAARSRPAEVPAVPALPRRHHSPGLKRYWNE